MRNRLLLLLLLAGLALPPRADAQCDTRPATAAETSANRAALNAFKKAVAPAPQGWDVSQETTMDELTSVCKGNEEYPSKYSFSRSYSNTAAIDGRQASVNQKVAALVNGQEARAASNARDIAALDMRIEALQKSMEAEVASGRTAELESVGKEMAALFEKRARLESGDAGAQHDAIAAEAERPRPPARCSARLTSPSSRPCWPDSHVPAQNQTLQIRSTALTWDELDVRVLRLKHAPRG